MPFEGIARLLADSGIRCGKDPFQIKRPAAALIPNMKNCRSPTVHRDPDAIRGFPFR